MNLIYISHSISRLSAVRTGKLTSMMIRASFDAVSFTSSRDIAQTENMRFCEKWNDHLRFIIQEPDHTDGRA